MTVFKSPGRLLWGELDVPMFGLGKDWFGEDFQPAAGFSLAMDQQRLWFIANHRKPAELHPKSRPGAFQAELWRYDVAELFIADPRSGRYFEFNLAPNGAWWTCEFTAPRKRAEVTDIAMPEIATFAEMAPDGSWLAAMAIPLDLLKARLGFGAETKMNVTMILDSPSQKFLSASNLGDGEPDFHQPHAFSTIRFAPIPKQIPPLD
ncbi:MAG: hypothetical protein ABI600_17615 [Luteolibacter sp.]